MAHRFTDVVASLPALEPVVVADSDVDDSDTTVPYMDRTPPPPPSYPPSPTSPLLAPQSAPKPPSPSAPPPPASAPPSCYHAVLASDLERHVKDLERTNFELHNELELQSQALETTRDELDDSEAERRRYFTHDCHHKLALDESRRDARMYEQQAAALRIQLAGKVASNDVLEGVARSQANILNIVQQELMAETHKRKAAEDLNAEHAVKLQRMHEKLIESRGDEAHLRGVVVQLENERDDVKDAAEQFQVERDVADSQKVAYRKAFTGSVADFSDREARLRACIRKAEGDA
jgi:hypothetical protein